MTALPPADALLAACPIVPVVVIDDAADAIPLGQALLAGGITVAEVTLRTAAGLAAIEAMSSLDGLTVGAGTVITPAELSNGYAAGAQFIVSPGLSEPVVLGARQSGLPALPGVATATELMAAMALGLNTVKFFPAGQLGGPQGIVSLSGPFPTMRFLPSGGVATTNMADYLALEAVPAVSGSWMVERGLLASGDWAEVTRRCTEAMALAQPAPPSA